MVALHDCNEDVNRAINFLLESTTDTVRIGAHSHTVHTSVCYKLITFNKKKNPSLELLGDGGEEAKPGERRGLIRDKRGEGEERRREGSKSWTRRVHQARQRDQSSS